MAVPAHVWVVRGGDNNELAPLIESKQAVGIGWDVVGDVHDIASREDLKNRLEQAAPGTATPNAVGQLFRFAKEMTIGDYVLTPEKTPRTVHITRCVGDYRYDPGVFGDTYPHVRPVEFLKTVHRSVFPQTVRNTLGSTLTVFRADIALPYVEAQLGLSVTLPPDKGSAEIGVWADEIEGQANGQILDALDNIEHHDFQVLVGGLLQGMGYNVQIGPRGKDGGVDFLAHRDVFGLEPPRIKGQTKNQRNPAGIQDVGYLNGVLGQGENGLFVCTGGFTKDASSQPFVSNGRISLVDGVTLLNLILANYERFPDRSKALLPLRRIYIPERVSADS